MNWSDERYVRLYTRDSATWLSWGWEAQGVFCLLLRKVDRSGVIDTGKRDQVAALSRLLGVPQDVTARVLAEWMADETVVATPTAYVIPKFLEAQEARQSDAVRQRESRERRLAAAKAQNTEVVCHTPSHAVTDSHTMSQPVTPAVPSQPSRAEPAVPKKLAPDKPAPSRETDELCRVFEEVTGAKYVWQGAKDATAFHRLRKHASVEEICARWRKALGLVGWKQAASVAQLASKWNDLAVSDTDVRKAPMDGEMGTGPLTATVKW